MTRWHGGLCPGLQWSDGWVNVGQGRRWPGWRGVAGGQRAMPATQMVMEEGGCVLQEAERPAAGSHCCFTLTLPDRFMLMRLLLCMSNYNRKTVWQVNSGKCSVTCGQGTVTDMDLICLRFSWFFPHKVASTKCWWAMISHDLVFQLTLKYISVF